MSPVPTVMLSSTFFDLQQVRSDLKTFLENELGYHTLLSEFSSFPIDPDLDTVENCKRNVRKASVLVLVVGGRYGSLDSRTEKSITNLEYLEARKKGIPVYVFAKKGVLEILPVWKKNPEADFSGLVDTTNLFDFLSGVREQERVWVFPFETAQDIVAALRGQFAHLMLEALELRRRLQGGGIPSYLNDASPALLQIALHRPDSWEHLLFTRAWCDQVDDLADAIRAYKAGIRAGPADRVETHDISGWMSARLEELRAVAEDSTALLNRELPIALGQPGEHGDAEHLIWVAKELGHKLANALGWTSRVRRASIPEEADEVRSELVGFSSQIIDELENFPRRALSGLEDALVAYERGEGPQEVRLTLEFTSPDVAAFDRALASYARAIGLSPALG